MFNKIKIVIKALYENGIFHSNGAKINDKKKYV